MNTRIAPTLTALASLVLLSACSTPQWMANWNSSTAGGVDQASLPAAVRVPVGNRMVLETVGVGLITYECKAKDGAHAWTFAGPEARLVQRQNKTVGRYFGPPATWAHEDGSSITGTQVAVAPGGDGNIPMQLVKADPANGVGAMSGVTFVQRIRTRGGVAPALPCGADNAGARTTVNYQADYLFFKAG